MLGGIVVVSVFGLFYLGERVLHLDRAHHQTLMYPKPSVGYLTIFLTRTRGPVLFDLSDTNLMRGRVRNPDRVDGNRGLWTVNDVSRLEMDWIRFGLRAFVVRREQPLGKLHLADH